ncbi:hypothetical protein [uncultured Roseibium sp.]|uniref:hypothetical protein n=1 Tax=uncultured Roseibium sp. TaxID=1936171 RepID=UPI00261A9359|nr:hypothetical protein [uncultured Roseibium sp.]
MLKFKNGKLRLHFRRARVSLLAVAAWVCGLLAVPVSASAQLAFSADCRDFQAIPVVAPNDAILFSKHPVPHPDGTATVFAINGLENYVVPNGFNSCVVAAPAANDSYCFQARSDNTIDQVGFRAIRDPGGLTPCQ